MNPESDVDVAIIGGGVLGASIAWHLVRSGVERVALIERHSIGSGSSALAAGLVSHARSDRDVLSMVCSTFSDIAELEAASDQFVGLRRSGSLRIAEFDETAQQLATVAQLLDEANVENSFIDANDASERVPWLDVAAAQSILSIPSDGYVDGQSLALAYARAAKIDGATILTGTSVLGAQCTGGRVTALETSRGSLRCRQLVNAAGPWAGQILGWFDETLAATPLRSHYWVTAPAEPRWPDHPIVVMPDAHTYLRPEVGGLLIGVQERASRTFDDRCLPDDLSQLALSGPEDWDLLSTCSNAIRRYFPAFETLNFKQHLAGITTYTPDRRFLIGRIPGLDNAFVASGCCGTGVSCAGGIARLLRDLVLDRTTEVNAAAFAPDRFADEDPRSQAFISRCVSARANKGLRS